MASNGWNVRDVNHMMFYGHAQHIHHPNHTHSHIACRMCNQVFSTNQALINHIESHMIRQDEIPTRRQLPPSVQLMPSQAQREFIPNPNSATMAINLNLPSPMAMDVRMMAPPRINPFIGGGSRGAPMPAAHQTPPMRLWIPPVPRFHETRVVEADNRTKPFIKQLEHPYKVPDVAETSYARNNLDLTLKL